jgi:hypothetical protein
LPIELGAAANMGQCPAGKKGKDFKDNRRANKERVGLRA